MNGHKQVYALSIIILKQIMYILYSLFYFIFTLYLVFTLYSYYYSFILLKNIIIGLTNLQHFLILIPKALDGLLYSGK